MKNKLLYEDDSLNWRFERKFSGQGLSVNIAEASVRMHPAIFRKAFPPRWINNIYLDTPSLEAYWEHTNGASHRVKTRIRWYGEADGFVSSPVLERKIKCALEGTKISHALPAFTVDGMLTSKKLAQVFENAALPPATLEDLRYLRPILFNRYYRLYFVSADKRFRLTVDFQLSFRPIHNFGGQWRSPVSQWAGVIIELKYDRSETEAASEITQALPFRMSRFSKYVTGVNFLRTG
jgi:hypothetical protein